MIGTIKAKLFGGPLDGAEFEPESDARIVTLNYGIQISAFEKKDDPRFVIPFDGQHKTRYRRGSDGNYYHTWDAK